MYTPDLLEYDINFLTYTESGMKLTADCNKMWFYNVGKNTVLINDNLTLLPAYSVPLKAGFNLFSFETEGNLFEIDRTQYTIKFISIEPNSMPIIPHGNKLVVVRKTYKNIDAVRKYMAAIIGNGQK